MNKTVNFRRAIAGEIPRILEIIAHAKAQMKARGSAQWQDGYPAEADIASDIEHGNGWVLDQSMDGCSTDDLPPIAYGAVVFDGEPAYMQIEGQWLTEMPYVVVHRLAVADKEQGQGIAAEFMLRVGALACERGIGSFRVDTNFDNAPMLHLLEKQGFVYCGRIHYQSGERLAFEKKY